MYLAYDFFFLSIELREYKKNGKEFILFEFAVIRVFEKLN